MGLSKLLNNGSSLPTFSHPFKQEALDHLSIQVYSPKSFVGGGRIRVIARIDFKQGDLSGEKKIEGGDLMGVIQECEAFLKSLEKS